MPRDPEEFKFMPADMVWQTLVSDMAQERADLAGAQGAKCVRCLDTGMDGGKFCSCRAGVQLGHQGFKK